MDKKTYYLYGKIRFIVGDAKCDRMMVDDVIANINERHYKLIEDFYGFNKEEVDNIINSMKTTPPLKKSKKE